MSKAPIWPVATDALIADTTHLSAEEFGGYVLLMVAQWRSNGAPLPTDETRLARMARLSPKVWSRSRNTIAELFEISDDGWRQKRVEKDWLIVSEKIDKNRENGSLGGKAKSLKKNKPMLADATNSPSKKSSENVAIHEPYPEPEEPSSLRSDTPSDQKPVAPKRERKTKTAIPDGCPTSSDREAAEKFWRDRGRDDLCARLADEADAFRAHHAAHGSRMDDWSAAWRTWYGNALKFNRKPQNERASKNGSAATNHRQMLEGAFDFAGGTDGLPEGRNEPGGTPRLAIGGR